ncbi:hypothetical protein DPMN_187799 [Dreissena polymorpha]|uniref:Fibronectin type-III domain-containing protein n=1 Tax=Dreissena polymorpha TaxID=45954 RepID=A0A9D4DQH0_DREPO|nr:hypothetical protein DPMN_187799 [Dreissena polymorpha]
MLVSEIPRVKFDSPEVYDMDDTSLSLRWKTVDVPAFTYDEEPLLFIIERQILPSYEWEPVVTNISDRSYIVRDLLPYRDYNFRVRGVHPSGYTAPSPAVPVYRRPSESKLDAVGVDSATISKSSQTAVRAISSVSNMSLWHKQYSELETISRTLPPRYGYPSLHRRYTLANIYDVKPIEQPIVKPLVVEPRFKREEAYVYQRSQSPSKTLDVGPVVKLPPVKDSRERKLDQKYDLYQWYLQRRRFSEAGLEDVRRRNERSRRDQMYQQHRREILIEAPMRALPPKSRSVSFRTHDRTEIFTEPSIRDPSVADRYEDIKTPYIVAAGHWRFARRHSVALDYEDYIHLMKAQEKQRRLVSEARLRSIKPRPKTDIDLISQSQDEYFRGTYFIVEDEVNLRDRKPTIARRSLSQERDPGYFIISKFSLSVSGVKAHKPTRPASLSRDRHLFVRPVSLEPSPVVKQDFRNRTSFISKQSYHRSMTPDQLSTHKTRSLTPDLHLSARTRSLTPDMEELRRTLQRRSDNVANELMRPIFRRSSISRASTDRASVRRSSPPRHSSPHIPASQPFIKPRSQSISVPAAGPKFNRDIADSKSLISSYETIDHRSSNQLALSRGSSVARSVRARSNSVADLRLDPRFTSMRRESVSSKPPVHEDTKSDPRFTSTPRGSMSSVPRERRRSNSQYNLQLDARFAQQRRSSIVSSTNEDLKSKLDTLTSQMSVPKSRRSSRPVIKFKSSKGEGSVSENDWQPQSSRLSTIYHQLK